MGNNIKKTYFLETSIFPLLSLEKPHDKKHFSVEYLGTCFLMNLANQHVFITCKHVIPKTEKNYDLYITYKTPNEPPVYVKVEALLTEHLNEDVTFFIPLNQMKSKYNNYLYPMKPL